VVLVFRMSLTPKAFCTVAQACRGAATLGGLDDVAGSRYVATMPQSLSNVLVHIVFSTKERRPSLSDPTLRVAMHKYLGAVSTELRCPVIKLGGAEDHVHLLARQARTITLAGWVRELKRTSSLWVKELSGGPTAFQWQAGYGAFSVSQSQSAAVERYIARQEAHHHRFSFQDEFRTLLERHQVEYDERYLWD
jgi:REP-associated tyrosine transposase